MRTETIIVSIIIMVALVGLLPLVVPNDTGLVIDELPAYVFGPDFDAVIITGETIGHDESNAIDLVAATIPKQYATVSRPLRYGEPTLEWPYMGIQKAIISEKEIDFSQVDAIVIGTLCHNSVAKQLLNVHDCELYFRKGTGFIKLVERFGHNYLIITGYNEKDVLDATKYFVNNFNIAKLRGRNIEYLINDQKAVQFNFPKYYTSPSVRTTSKDTLSILGSKFVIK